MSMMTLIQQSHRGGMVGGAEERATTGRLLMGLVSLFTGSISFLFIILLCMANSWALFVGSFPWSCMFIGAGLATTCYGEYLLMTKRSRIIMACMGTILAWLGVIGFVLVFYRSFS